ncbi:MAG: transporter ATP-binding protein [Naasia sp.]|uniref:metal ABC transporter ATP-binding protein n=1 Tax=Naasia sp. TaxID=2546198 RepID=UPI003420301F|nr:transporter ATP-binding protein [Naasia sp.]
MVIPSAGSPAPALELSAATLELGGRVLWRDLDLRLAPGEFLAVLGPNGAGKSSLLRAVLGQQPLASGAVRALGRPITRGREDIGYIPQQRLFDRDTALRTRDLVALGLDGTRFGPGWPSRGRRQAIDAALERTGLLDRSRAPLGLLSGGEQQRARISQALVSAPGLLLCDEPLLSLDLAHQRAVSDAIDGHRRETSAGVVMVTHDINPVLGLVDKVLYLAAGRHLVGPPTDVLRTEVLSDLYGTHVDVLNVHGRIVVVGPPSESGSP